MSHVSAFRLLVLHGVRLKGFAEPAAIARLWSLDEGGVAAELKGLAEEGLIRRREGRITGWALTADGRAADAELVASELDSAGAREAIDDAYRRFLGLNAELLATCTAWQLRTTATGQVVNDHTDPTYDAEVVHRLAVVHDAVGPLLDDLAATLGRFGPYRDRLGNAVRLVQGGESGWFTKPLVDSYHTVWFELHEDLLSTLGLQRGSEGR